MTKGNRKGPARDGAKEQAWRKRLASQRREKVSVREFCRRNRLSEASFYAWRRELTRRDAESLPASRAPTPLRRTAAPHRDGLLHACRKDTASRTASVRPGDAKSTARSKPRTIHRGGRAHGSARGSSGTAPFVELAVRTIPNSGTIEIVMPDGARVLVPPGAASGDVREVLIALRGAGGAC